MNRFFLVDCNNFFVSCERLFNPKLNNKPVVVLSSNDSCVIARSNEAKTLGIAMGAPAFECIEIFKKHNVITYSANFGLYCDMSSRVMKTLADYATDIEVYSIDEAFLFVAKPIEPATYLSEGYFIKKKVAQATGIPVSIGIGPTKTLAKIATRLAKKSPSYKGVFDITNHPEIDTFLASIEVGDIWGIGSRYAKLLRSNRITNACEFKYLDEKWVRKNMTIVGHKTLLELRGIPCIGLQDCPEPKKSITVSRMFGKKTTNITYVKEGLAHYVAGAAQKLRAQSSLTSLVTVFIVAAPLYEPRNIYDAVTLELSMGTNYTPELIEVAHRCLAKLLRPGFIYKKVGVTLHNFVSDNHMQLNTLYSIKENFTKDREKRLKFMDVLDKVTTKWGKNIIFFGAEGIEQEWRMNQAKKSANFTTNWHELLTINLT